jgi:hypothetical protein
MKLVFVINNNPALCKIYTNRSTFRDMPRASKIIIIIIIHLTANGLSPGGSGYNACT